MNAAYTGKDGIGPDVMSRGRGMWRSSNKSTDCEAGLSFAHGQ